MSASTTDPVVMKAIVAACLLIAPALHAQETVARATPISGDDIAQILKMDVKKVELSFNCPKYVTIRCEAANGEQDFHLDGPATRVTLLTWLPPKQRSLQEFWFCLAGEDKNSVTSYMAVDTSKAKVWVSGVVDGIYTMSAGETEDRKASVYSLQVLTSDNKP